MPYGYLVLFCILAGVSMFTIDTTVVNVALATLQGVFAVDVSTVQWAIAAYALASGMITPLADYFKVRWGMRQLWLGGLTGFMLSSLLCGLAPAFPVLVIGRILQGVSGGLLLPIGISTIYRVFPPGRRGLAMGFMAIP